MELFYFFGAKSSTFASFITYEKVGNRKKIFQKTKFVILFYIFETHGKQIIQCLLFINFI